MTFLRCCLAAVMLHNSIFFMSFFVELHTSQNGKEPQKRRRCHAATVSSPVPWYILCLFVQAAFSLNVPFCSLLPPPRPRPPATPSPSASNPCEKNDGRGPCSHLCLINYNRTASCTCPHLMKLSPNKQSCFGESEPALPARFCSVLR